MIVLDTHAWIWWLSDPDQLSRPARTYIDNVLSESAPVYISSISTWEVAMLVEKGRLELTIDVEDWLAHSEAIDAIEFIPVSNHLALRSVQLPGPFHPDPADRLIVATARYLGLPLITRDSKMHDYPHVQTIW
ncbi:PIN domain nuclease of toxin-antitoxin system [Methylohalomonas lacus]|uniref:Ribonuclease VapC n=1 Tax=Methylohalomonas lacus TaxID=398773 RepID=A0AAE3L2G2_9GAMM|nr:type II toxin-antitoxin system VapC family toxin [Methylohalomonas lacus]MCS3904511.1 PIN domain nuclease of toxin-antitoxin system [Methylohalomonas lacus]